MVNLRKKTLTALKIVFSILLLYFIFTKIPFSDIFELVRQSNLTYILLAALLFVFSKAMAAIRLNLYFHSLSVFLTQLSNFRLYLLGMFYNLFLPGGIGGDAYKGYIIKKKFDVSTSKVISILLLDRLSGLLLLFVYACFFAFFLSEELLGNYRFLFIPLVLLSVLIFWGLNKRKFAYTYSIFWKSLAYSAIVQLAQIGCTFLILKSLGIAENQLAYLFIFLLSSIVSVIPLTIGGIGSRELVFFYGALWLGLEENTSVAISLLFFLITALVSFFGIFYHFKKPELRTTPQA